MWDYIVNVAPSALKKSPSRCVHSLISGWSHTAAEVDASSHTSPLMQAGTTESCDNSSIDVSWTERNLDINKTCHHLMTKNSFMI